MRQLRPWILNNKYFKPMLHPWTKTRQADYKSLNPKQTVPISTLIFVHSNSIKIQGLSNSIIVENAHTPIPLV